MSITGDSWHKVSAEAPADGINDDANANEPQNQEHRPEREGREEQKERKLIVSDANVEEGSGGMLRQALGGLTLFLVVAVWVVGALAPLIACALLWVGSSVAHTILAGLVAAGVYPYVAASSGENEEGNAEAGWPAFRFAIPRWGQYWHRSCGRVYEEEGPESWDNMPPTVACYHPHGVFTQGYILNGGLNEELPRIVGLLAPALYHAPLFRLVFGRWTGACLPSSKPVFIDQMKKGLSFGIIPGGFQEATLSKLGADRVWMKNRKGLIKYALQYGYRLRPCFTFGESDTYWNAQGLWKLRLWMSSKNLPGVLPWGIWWCPLLPRRVNLMTVFGQPIVLPKLEAPSTEDVDKWHATYLGELRALHGRHRAKYSSNPHQELESSGSFLEATGRTIAQRNENAVFARWYNGKGQVESTWTYHGMWAASGEVAHLLRMERGLQKGDRVVLAFDFGLSFFAVFLGCLRAGIIAVPVYPPNPAKLSTSLQKLRLIVDDCTPKMIIVSPAVNKLRLASKLRAIASGGNGGWPSTHYECPDVKEEKSGVFGLDFMSGWSQRKSFDDPSIKAEDVAFLQFTSGSTSEPKGVMLTFANLEHNTRWLTHHSESGTLAPFVAGWRAAYCSPITFMRNPLIWLKLMSKEKSQLTAAPDFAFRLCVRKWNGMTPEDRAALNLDLSNVMMMQNAAEPIRASTGEEDLDFISDELLQACGSVHFDENEERLCEDIEFAAQDASPLVRPGCIAAFSEEELGGDLQIVLELRKSSSKDDGDEILGALEAVRRNVMKESGLCASIVVAVKERTIPKTTSGKIQRRRTRALLQGGGLEVVHELAQSKKFTKPAFKTVALPPSDNHRGPDGGVNEGSSSGSLIPEIPSLDAGHGDAAVQGDRDTEAGITFHSQDVLRVIEAVGCGAHVANPLLSVDRETGRGAEREKQKISIGSKALVGFGSFLGGTIGDDAMVRAYYSVPTPARNFDPLRQGAECGLFPLDCLDPDHAGDELYECEAPPPASLPCSAEVQREWVVENAAEAQALTTAVNCSGGSFEVEWRGTVVVDKPIYVVDGTTLTITGVAGSMASIDGSSSTRLFTVVNAALHVDGLNVSYGTSIAGGAIAAARSALSFNRTIFVGNSAVAYGGAVFVSNASSVSCAHGTTFVENTAGTDGGAIFAAGGSEVSCGGRWLSNAAGARGGALRLVDESSASWTEETFFEFNAAEWVGGAFSLAKSSRIFWDAPTDFYNNSAGFFGGAFTISDQCAVSWQAGTSFYSNSAGISGGAVYVQEDSNVSWSGEGNNVFDGNHAGSFGGALGVGVSSQASCTASTTTTFVGNSAFGGGAIFVVNASLYFFGETSFLHNAAIGDPLSTSSTGNPPFENDTGSGGGALFMVAESNISWVGQTNFSSNVAASNGGALAVADGSALTVDGAATFADNKAVDQDEAISGSGGAVSVFSDSSIVWRGERTEFIGNVASFGSALHFSLGSHASWDPQITKFVDNSAGAWGTLLASASEVIWSGETVFEGNDAASGAAIFLLNDAYVGWTGETTFSSNKATIDGGAVASPESDPTNNPQNSTLHIGATTTFLNNTSGANGGGLSLLGACALKVDPGVDVSYVSNSAAVSGGAVFVSGAGTGPAFYGAMFVSNSAQVGGAVATFGSGNSKSVSEAEPPDPTTFDRCRLVGNRATTGGAIDSAAGYDSIVDSIFEDNVAGTGGALRLAGTTSIDGCSFVENFSDNGGGAVVSNIGTLSRMADISFSRNGFNCPAGMFLDFDVSGDPYDAACDGCQIACDGCVFAEPLLAPICTEAMAHSSSSGGRTTLEELLIERGYWRATNLSETVLACYNADACLGGKTGTSDYCRQGYEGPYCAICSEGYTAQFGFVCSKCSSSAAGVALAVVLAVVTLLVAGAVVSYATTGEGNGTRRGLVERVARYVPLQSVKIVIVAWQILTQFTELAKISYPAVYQTLLDGLNVVNFDLSRILSAGCIVDFDFHDRLLMSTIGPIIAMLFLGCTYAAAVRTHKRATETLQNVRHKHVSLVLLLTFFVYSSVSSVLFSTFSCEVLDDGKDYLRSDYRIECDSPKHKGFKVYAGFMIVVYTVGIPAFYAGLLFKDREVLRQPDRGNASRVSSTSDLWKPYKPSVFYYEVIECVRRILLAGVVVFIYPNSAAQVAVTLMIAFAFVLVSEALAPYASRWDHWISRTGHVVVVASMYVALLLKVDVSDERSSSQKVFEVVLVAVHVVMVLVVVVETVVMGLALTAEHREIP
eukprot:g15868.t1